MTGEGGGAHEQAAPRQEQPQQNNLKPVEPKRGLFRHTHERHLGRLAQGVRNEGTARSYLALLQERGTRGVLGRAVLDTLRHPIKSLRGGSESAHMQEADHRLAVEAAHAMGVTAQVSLTPEQQIAAGITTEGEHPDSPEVAQQKAREWLQRTNPQALHVLEQAEIATMQRVTELTEGSEASGFTGMRTTRGEGEAILRAQPVVTARLTEQGGLDVTMTIVDPRVGNSNKGESTVVNPDGTVTFSIDSHRLPDKGQDPVYSQYHSGQQTGSVIRSTLSYVPRRAREGGVPGTDHAHVVVNGESVDVDHGEGNINPNALTQAYDRAFSPANELQITSVIVRLPNGEFVQVEQVGGELPPIDSSLGRQISEVNHSGQVAVLGRDGDIRRYENSGGMGSRESVVTPEGRRVVVEATHDQAESIAHLTDAEKRRIFGNVEIVASREPKGRVVEGGQMDSVRSVMGDRRYTSEHPKSGLTEQQQQDPAYRLWNLDRNIQITVEGRVLSGVEAANIIARRVRKAVEDARTEAQNAHQNFDSDAANRLALTTLQTELQTAGVDISPNQQQEYIDSLYGDGPQARVRIETRDADRPAEAHAESLVDAIVAATGIPRESARLAAEHVIRDAHPLNFASAFSSAREIGTKGMSVTEAEARRAEILGRLDPKMTQEERDALDIILGGELIEARRRSQGPRSEEEFSQEVRGGDLGAIRRSMEDLREGLNSLGLGVSIQPIAQPNGQTGGQQAQSAAGPIGGTQARQDFADAAGAGAGVAVPSASSVSE